MIFRQTHIPGAERPILTKKSHRLRAIVQQAATSEAAVALLIETALGAQPERALVSRLTPRWASRFMEAH